MEKPSPDDIVTVFMFNPVDCITRELAFENLQQQLSLYLSLTCLREPLTYL